MLILKMYPGTVINHMLNNECSQWHYPSIVIQVVKYNVTWSLCITNGLPPYQT